MACPRNLHKYVLLCQEILRKVCGNFAVICGKFSALTPSRTTPQVNCRLLVCLGEGFGVGFGGVVGGGSPVENKGQGEGGGGWGGWGRDRQRNRQVNAQALSKLPLSKLPFSFFPKNRASLCECGGDCAGTNEQLKPKVFRSKL